MARRAPTAFGASTKLLVAVVASVAVLGLVTAAMVLPGVRGIVGTPGGDVRDYVARQVIGIANAYLHPEIDFETSAYEAPGTFRLLGATLTGADGTRVIDVEALTITLGKVPRVGEPIVIERVALEGGTVRLVFDEKGGPKAFDPFVKRDPTDQAEEQEVEENFRLSNVLELRNIDISGVDLVYETAGEAEPMRLDALELALDIKPAGEPGWYAASIDAGREPGLTLDSVGRFNVDEGLFDFKTSTARADLGAETRRGLPPQLRGFLESRDARGSAELTFSGRLPIASFEKADLAFALRGSGVNLAAGEYRLPLDALEVDADLDGGNVTVSRIDANLLGGTLAGSGQGNIAAEPPAGDLRWSITNVELREFLRTKPGGDEPPKLAGRTTGSGVLTFSRAADGGIELGGRGKLDVVDGRLVAIPIIPELTKVVADGGGGDGSLDHELQATFNVHSENLELTEGKLTTSAIVARGTGTIGYDGALDLSLNAGPLEKLQSLLGRVGDIFGKITDQLVKYRVKGTVDDPKVSVAPLGIGG